MSIAASLLVLSACSSQAATDQNVDVDQNAEEVQSATAVETQPNEDNAPIALLATTTIWADVLQNVACESQADVKSIMPAGSDPHGFELSLAGRSELENAELILSNGLGLEENLLGPLEVVEAGGTPVFAMAENVGAGLIGRDPHIWFDPVLVAAALPALTESLVAAGLDPIETQRCSRQYEEELMALDSELEEILAEVPDADRKLVTNHHSLGYFASRYDFEVIGTVLPSNSTLAEANPQALQELADAIESEGVSSIFVDATASTDDAEQLASTIGGVEVVPLLSASLSEAEGDGDTYVSFIRVSAQRIAAALN